MVKTHRVRSLPIYGLLGFMIHSVVFSSAKVIFLFLEKEKIQKKVKKQLKKIKKTTIGYFYSFDNLQFPLLAKEHSHVILQR